MVREVRHLWVSLFLLLMEKWLLFFAAGDETSACSAIKVWKEIANHSNVNIGQNLYDTNRQWEFAVF